MNSRETERLYFSLRREVMSWLISRQLSEDAALDIYQEAFCIYIEALEDPDKEIRKGREYIKGICLNLLREEFRKRPMEELDEGMVVKRSDFEWKDQYETHIKKLTKKCREILNLEKQGYTFREIAKKMKLKDNKRASDDSRYCKRLLRDMIAAEIRAAGKIKS